ncbi:MAG TPA: glycosyltransferase [Gaiellaceae bacterium]|nr:glycosyltransferase [Gaiellaceae bacterium]
MRVLFASTHGSGHFNPLVPLAEACLRGGHEVLVAGTSLLAPAVEERGYPFRECGRPREEDIRPIWDRVPTIAPEAANELVVREIFARLNVLAILPRLRAAIEEWGPDLVLRDPNEYGSAVAAELHGVPHARVAIGLGAVEEGALRLAAGPLDEIRRSLGLPADPEGDRIRRTPFLSSFPASLEYPDEPSPPHAPRFRGGEAESGARPLPDWWPGRDGPLVYVTLGSVTASIPAAAAAYPVVIEAMADVPARVLLTVGRAGDPDALGPLPANVHVERWVPHADVVAAADAVVCHGGSGTVIGTLAAGLPQVVVPLFADQPYNAERVAAVGAGLAVAPAGESAPAAIRTAVGAVLGDESYRLAAERLAAEMRRSPEADSVLETLLAQAAAV